MQVGSPRIAYFFDMPYFVDSKPESSQKLSGVEPGSLEVHRALEDTREQFLMSVYDFSTEALQDYSSVCVEFGLIVLFSMALPIACLLAFISVAVEIRSDAFKILYGKQVVIKCYFIMSTYFSL